MINYCFTMNHDKDYMTRFSKSWVNSHYNIAVFKLYGFAVLLHYIQVGARDV